MPDIDGVPTMVDVAGLKERIEKVAAEFEGNVARGQHDTNTVRTVIGLITIELDEWVARLVVRDKKEAKEKKGGKNAD